jgi:hypothetical protein
MSKVEALRLALARRTICRICTQHVMYLLWCARMHMAFTRTTYLNVNALAVLDVYTYPRIRSIELGI